jgi:hypothetical protein
LTQCQGQRGPPKKKLETLADYLDLHIVTGKARRKKG